MARLLGVSQSLVWSWLFRTKRGVPAEWCRRVEMASGISVHELRPDIYPLADGVAVDHHLGSRADLAAPTGDRRLLAFSRALEIAGGQAKLARALGISTSAVNQWIMVPPLRVLEVEGLTGVHRSELRPDFYPPSPAISGPPPLAGPDLAAFEEAKFKAYQDAFHKNAANPNLVNAAALVAAWNAFADAVGVDRV